MGEEITDRADFDALFRQFERIALRWEAQGEYTLQDAELEPWRRWHEGHRDGFDWLRPWLDTVRNATCTGRRIARVRMLTQPLTDYLRWQLDVTPANLSAGEDIQVISEATARELALPEHDFWVFDDRRVVVLRFDELGLAGAETLTDPEIVERHCRWLDIAFAHAQPFHQYRDSPVFERGP